MNKLRIGIIGAGYMAGVHAKSLSTIKNVEITAICHPKVKPENLIGTYGIKLYFKDYKKMFDEANLDAIVISIPPFAHSGEVEYAAEKGVHVFLEKPIALTVDRAESMACAVEKAGIKSMVAYMMRYGVAVSKLKHMIDSGEAGRITLMDARYECNSLHTPWWRIKEKSGGQVLEQIIHLYDIGLFLAGQPKSAVGFVANLCHTDVEDYTVEDTSSGIITFENGAIASISGTNCAVPMQWNGLFTVICKNVTVHFKDPNNAEFIYTSGPEPVVEVVSSDNNLYLEEMKAFIDLISGKDSKVATIADGLMGLKMVDSVINSNGQIKYF